MSARQRTVDRRRFLEVAGAATVFSTMAERGAARELDPSPASDRLNIAGIGIGGMGASNLRNLETENIVALCDVDPVYAAETVARYPKATFFTDYRKMLEAQKDIDAVVVATPDHTHAVISLAALEAGKHVFCQKPLTHDIHEARTLAEASRASSVTTAMGIQGSSGEGIRLICEWIWDGAIGLVKEVDAWCSLSYYPWGHAPWSSPWGDRPGDTPTAPQSLDWDLWLGPALYRPYHPAYHPMVWRCWWDFGCGMMGDRGAHTLDSVYRALNLGHPSTVHASTLGGNEETHPLAAVVTYSFPARGDLPPLRLNWYEGLEPPRPAELEEQRTLPAEGGVLFKGERGVIMCGVYGDSPRLIPESAQQDYKGAPETLPRVQGSHEQDWVHHCKMGTQPNASFDYSGPLTEMTLLGNIAKRFSENVLEWDGPNMKVVNVAEANDWVKRPYRDGWTL